MNNFFTLPNFYINGTLYNFLLTQNKEHPEYFKMPFYINYVEGNFPYQIWNGGYNTCYGTGAYYNDFVLCLNNSLPNIRLNFSNCRLIKEDYDDVMGNNILKILETGSNAIEIADLELMQYIQENFPSYHFICSKNLFLYMDISQDKLNELIESDQFLFVSLPERYSFDFEFLDKIKYKNKIEITVNPRCPIYCNNYQLCRLSENTAQLNYSRESIILCDKRYPYFKSNEQLISCQNLIENYIPLGFHNFTFDPFSSLNEYNIQANATFILSYFVKPEYQMKLLQDFMIREREEKIINYD